MKALISQWFEQSAPFEGIQACCLRHVDQTCVSKAWADGYEGMVLDLAMQRVSETFQILQQNRLPQSRLRWIYESAMLHCERRNDGTCIGVFTLRDGQSFDRDGLERMFSEFHALSKIPSP